MGPIPRWKLLLVVLAVTLANKHVPAYLLGLVLVDLSSRLGCIQIPFPTTSGLRWSVLKPYLLTRLAAWLGPSPALCTLLVAPKAHYSQLRASSRYIVVRIHLPPASGSPRLRGAFVLVVSMACILRIQGSRACALDPWVLGGLAARLYPLLVALQAPCCSVVYIACCFAGASLSA